MGRTSGSPGADPGPHVAELVLDGDRQVGELVQRLRDAGLARARRRGSGEHLVDVALPSEVFHGRGQPLVHGFAFFVQRTKLCGVLAFHLVQRRVRQGCRRLLDDHLDQEHLVGRRFGPRADHQVAARAGEVAQHEGLGPTHTIHRDLAVRPVKAVDLGVQPRCRGAKADRSALARQVGGRHPA